MVRASNRPFYSCVLSVLAWIESEAGVAGRKIAPNTGANTTKFFTLVTKS